MAEITESKTIEEVFQELDTLAAKLEDSETSLEDSFRFYKEGMELLAWFFQNSKVPKEVPLDHPKIIRTNNLPISLKPEPLVMYFRTVF